MPEIINMDYQWQFKDKLNIANYSCFGRRAAAAEIHKLIA